MLPVTALAVTPVLTGASSGQAGTIPDSSH